MNDRGNGHSTHQGISGKVSGEGILAVGQADSVFDQPPSGSEECSERGVPAERSEDGAASA